MTLIIDIHPIIFTDPTHTQGEGIMGVGAKDGTLGDHLQILLTIVAM